MARSRTRTDARTAKGGFAPVVLSAVCLALAIPTAGFALSGLDQTATSEHAIEGFAPFTPASVDPRLAQRVALKIAARGQAMRFTPAGPAKPLDRTMTVAIRIDDETAHAISIRSAIAAATGEPGAASTALSATRYNLGVSRGYESFVKAPTLPEGLRDSPIPDLKDFQPGEGAKDKPSRFSARIALERDKGPVARAPRTIDSFGEQTVDLGGAFRLSRNLDVTAGVRLSQDRDRLAPLTDTQQDSQAVYVGTQFRF